MNGRTNINKKKKNSKGMVYCKNCGYFSFGYYCSKKKKSLEWKNKPRQCSLFKDIEEIIDPVKECEGCEHLDLREKIVYCTENQNIITTPKKWENELVIEKPDWCKI